MLSIGDEDKSVNAQISEFVRRLSEVCFQLLISDPPLVFDLKRIGEKVQFNQYKYDSMDGFIKNNEECLIILPSLHKYSPLTQNASTGSVIGE